MPPSGPAGLKRELGLRDLVLTQILFVVGLTNFGNSAKLGASHVVFWLVAIILFYIPQAMVVIHLNRWRPLEGGLYQWAHTKRSVVTPNHLLHLVRNGRVQILGRKK